MKIIDIDIIEGSAGSDRLPTYVAIERDSEHEMDGTIQDIVDPDRNFISQPTRIGERFPGIWNHLQKHHGIEEADEPIARSDGKFAGSGDLLPTSDPWRYANDDVEVRIHDVPTRTADTLSLL